MILLHLSQSSAKRVAYHWPHPLQDVTEAHAGDICALFGVECASGDTFISGGAPPYTMVGTLWEGGWEEQGHSEQAVVGSGCIQTIGVLCVVQLMMSCSYPPD